MLVYGLNVLKETDKKKIKKVYTMRKEIIPYLKENKLSYLLVDKKFLDKLCHGVHQGIVLDIYDYEYCSLDDIEGDFLVMLDHLEDPHNFGAIIRTCVAAGIKTIIIPKDRSAKVTDTVVKTSAGTISHIKIVMVNNLVATITKLQNQGFYFYGADMAGEDYQNVAYNAQKVLVIGNEGKGISRLVKEKLDEQIKIPMSPEAESLNASVAAGILIYGMRD